MSPGTTVSAASIQLPCSIEMKKTGGREEKEEEEDEEEGEEEKRGEKERKTATTRGKNYF